jgi:transposase-like protein
LANLPRELVTQTVEGILNRELNAHLALSQTFASGHNTGNSHNGISRKALQREKGKIKMQTPRDRKGSFEPQFIKKRLTRPLLNEQPPLSARGRATQNISAAIQERSEAEEVSPTIVL